MFLYVKSNFNFLRRRVSAVSALRSLGRAAVATNKTIDIIDTVFAPSREPTTFWSLRHNRKFFNYFPSISKAFVSATDAFLYSCSHCFHVVQIHKWSNMWSSPFRWDMDAIRKSKIRLRKNSFSAVTIPYISTIVKRLLSTLKICIAVVKENARRKKPEFIFEKALGFLSLLWYVVVLTGGADG